MSFLQLTLKVIFNDDIYCIGTYSNLCSNLHYWKLLERFN